MKVEGKKGSFIAADFSERRMINEYEWKMRESERLCRKRCQQHYHSLHWKKLSQKWLQFIMQLENPRKGSSISCFSGRSSVGNVGKNQHQYFDMNFHFLSI